MSCPVPHRKYATSIAAKKVARDIPGASVKKCDACKKWRVVI